MISGFAAGRADQVEGYEGVPHLRPTNITGGGELDFAEMKYVPPYRVAATDVIQNGEVLFNNTNSATWVGKSALFHSDEPCVCSNHITRLRLRNTKNKPDFLTAVVNALRSVGYFSALATNFNNQAGINNDALGALRIPIPSTKIQREIALEVESRRAEAQTLRTKSRTAWERARNEFEAALLDHSA